MQNSATKISFILVVLCAFVLPATPAYSAIATHPSAPTSVPNATEKPLSVRSGKSKNAWFRRIEKTEAVVMGIVALVGAGVCAWYVVALLGKTISGSVLAILLGMLGTALLLSAIVYAVILSKRLKEERRKGYK